jgi:2-polyprenyl-6-methoxyphenol hydroxylase-like FAD-dependent oxidoreductase
MVKALIAGGGIAGPVTAMALQHAGIEAQVYEAHLPGTGDAGSYLTVATNGLDALRAVGADKPVLAGGWGPSATAGGWPTGRSATPSSGPGCTRRSTRRRPAEASGSSTAGGWPGPSPRPAAWSPPSTTAPRPAATC